MLGVGLRVSQGPRRALLEPATTAGVFAEAPGDFWRRRTGGTGAHGLITRARLDPAARTRIACVPSALPGKEYTMAFGPFDSVLPLLGATPKRGLYLGNGTLMYWDAAQVIGSWPVAPGTQVGLELGGGEVAVLLRGQRVFGVADGGVPQGFMAYIYYDDTALLGLAVAQGG